MSWRRRADAWIGPVTLAAAVALFAPLHAVGDGGMFLEYVARLFGDSKEAVGWYPGLALMNAPFYALGKALGAAGVETVAGSLPQEALAALAGNVYMVVAAAACVWMLGVLDLPARAFAVVAAVVGSPLLFYGLFQPSGTHAAETVLVTAASALFLLRWQRPEWSTRLAIAVGVLLGLAAATRYSLAAMVAGLALVLLVYREFRVALLVVASSIAGFGLAYLPARLTGSPLFQEGGVSHTIGWAPLSPFRMLLTVDRGLLVWTPVMLLGVAGFVLLLRRRGDAREALAAIGAMQLAHLCFFFLVPDWFAGWSFSSRFFTSMLPLVALGIGELVRRWRRPTLALASLMTVWTLYLCLNLGIGIDVIPDQDRADLTSAADVALFTMRQGTTWKEYLYALWEASHLSG